MLIFGVAILGYSFQNTQLGTAYSLLLFTRRKNVGVSVHDTPRHS